jgi:hypothetical protein
MPAGGTCKKGAACWTQKPGQVDYRDTDQEHGAIKKFRVRAGVEGKASIRLKGSGPALALPRLPLDISPAVRMQLVNLGTGVCWDGTHASASTNDDLKFVSKSD